MNKNYFPDSNILLRSGKVALEALLINKFRTFLTMLGIIFGVAAVISMLAIGSGAEKEILEQIKLVGVNNIVINSILNQKNDVSGSLKDMEEKKKISPGLTLLDANSIKEIVPEVQRISPEIELENFVVREGKLKKAKLLGVNADYFKLTNRQLAAGSMFNQKQLTFADPVCILGNDLSAFFFKNVDPVGKYIKCGNIWLKVIGVLEKLEIGHSSIGKMGIRDFNTDIYSPVQTVIVRFKNRAMITKAMLEKAAGSENWDEGEKKPVEDPNYHQLDRIVVQINETNLLGPASEIILRLLKRRHLGVIDFEIIIPELLLKQQKKTQSIFHIVLGVIAGVSLIVGGIGIMNIMLASVLERTKEIGVRLSLGATKQDIVFQFIIEAVAISLIGGIIGIALGVVISLVISRLAEIATIVSLMSVFISFGVASLVGLCSGIIPAQRAAQQDPVVSIRYE